MAGDGARTLMHRLALVLSCMTSSVVRLDALAGDERANTPNAPPEYIARVNPIVFDDQARTDASSIYDRECRKCHGRDGEGRGSATRGMKIKPRDFTDPNFMSSHPDGQFFWIIMNGSDPDTTEMSGFKKKLTEDDAWKLVHFIREFAPRSPGEDEVHLQLINDHSYRGHHDESH